MFKFVVAMLVTLFGSKLNAELVALQDDLLMSVNGKNSMPTELFQINHHSKSDNLHSDSIPPNHEVIIDDPITSGITLDINLRLQIEEIRWVDQDGYGANGTQGAVTVRGLSVGHLDNGVLKPASIKGVTIDAAGNKGFVMGVGQIGDEFGNGLDVNIDSIQFK